MLQPPDHYSTSLSLACQCHWWTVIRLLAYWTTVTHTVTSVYRVLRRTISVVYDNLPLDDRDGVMVSACGWRVDVDRHGFD